MRLRIVKSIRPLLLVCSAVMVLALIAGVGGINFSAKNGGTPTAYATPLSLRGDTIGVIELYNNPFWVQVVQGVHKVLDPLGIKALVVNSNGDAGTQANNVTDVISANVSAAVFGPVAPAGALADISRMRKAGIPVYCVDSCATSAQSKKLPLGWVQNPANLLGSDVGQAAVNYIKAHMGGKATIAEVECNSLGPVCSDRYVKITALLKTVPGAHVVAMQGAF